MGNYVVDTHDILAPEKSKFLITPYYYYGCLLFDIWVLTFRLLITTPRQIEVIVAQDGAPAAPVAGYGEANWNAAVEIHKNGALLASIPVAKPFVTVRFTDTGPITGTSYGAENCVFRDGAYYINEYSNNPVDPDTLHTGGKDFYIVRIAGGNGRHSYIGPLWVEAP